MIKADEAAVRSRRAADRSRLATSRYAGTQARSAGAGQPEEAKAALTARYEQIKRGK